MQPRYEEFALSDDHRRPWDTFSVYRAVCRNPACLNDMCDPNEQCLDCGQYASQDWCTACHEKSDGSGVCIKCMDYKHPCPRCGKHVYDEQLHCGECDPEMKLGWLGEALK